MWDNIQSDFMDRVSEYSKRFPCTNFGAFIKILSQNVSINQKIDKKVIENDEITLPDKPSQV
jgi:hypothetical protein